MILLKLAIKWLRVPCNSTVSHESSNSSHLDMVVGTGQGMVSPVLLCTEELVLRVILCDVIFSVEVYAVYPIYATRS